MSAQAHRRRAWWFSLLACRATSHHCGFQDGKEIRTTSKRILGSLLGAFLAAFILAHVVARYFRRVLITTMLGLFAWVVVSIPYFDWYSYSLDYTPGQGIDQVAGCFLGGLIIAGFSHHPRWVEDGSPRFRTTSSLASVPARSRHGLQAIASPLQRRRGADVV